VASVTVYVLHENPEWYPPFAAAFDAEGVEHEQWLLGDGQLDLDAAPPTGVFWSRTSASSHTRGHPHAKDHARATLDWLESWGRRVVNGRRVLELEVSKANQLTALRAAGIDVPRTIAVAGTAQLAAVADKLPTPFIVKHNQGGKGRGVRKFDSAAELVQYVSSDEYEAPVDGITLLQEYVEPARPFITRVEVVGGEFVYALTADTARGGFELCPADACAVPSAADPAQGPEPSLFALRTGFDHPIVGEYLRFADLHGIGVAGFEFIETADGRLVTYDVNTTTNYNAEIEAAAPRSAARQMARYLGRLLDEERSARSTAERATAGTSTTGSGR
jgi:glutathione synthase/RimK-type ligase-like ATP-grasp enzyme